MHIAFWEKYFTSYFRYRCDFWVRCKQVSIFFLFLFVPSGTSGANDLNKLVVTQNYIHYEIVVDELINIGVR